jgi:phospholipase C
MSHLFTKAIALIATTAMTLFPVRLTFHQGGYSPTATPIRHLVVIFQENVSFVALLTNNPNLNPANGTGATNPFRLDPSQAVTKDQGHGYLAEQHAFDKGVMDLFPLFVGKSGPPPTTGGVTSTIGLNLGYFDGNTVTALWNYA